MKNLLSIAGTDPTGGAGIQTDLKTFEAHGEYGMAVIAAVVAQNTFHVHRNAGHARRSWSASRSNASLRTSVRTRSKSACSMTPKSFTRSRSVCVRTTRRTSCSTR